jgi:hypothetical protein
MGADDHPGVRQTVPIMVSPANRTASEIDDQQFVEFERTVQIVLSRRREAARDGDAGERHRDAAADLYVQTFVVSPARSVPWASRRARAARLYIVSVSGNGSCRA